MNWYIDITIFENKSRIARLKEFRGLLQSYLSNSQFLWMAGARSENDEAKAVREKINLAANVAQLVISYSGVATTVQHTPPPVVGGYITTVDLFANFFALHDYGVPYQHIIDLIDRAIGGLSKQRESRIDPHLQSVLVGPAWNDLVRKAPNPVPGRDWLRYEESRGECLG